MEFGVFLVWDCLGDVKFGKRIHFEMTWFFCREKVKERMEAYLVVRFLVFVEGDKLESIRKQRNV